MVSMGWSPYPAITTSTEKSTNNSAIMEKRSLKELASYLPLTIHSLAGKAMGPDDSLVRDTRVPCEILFTNKYMTAKYHKPIIKPIDLNQK